MIPCTARLCINGSQAWHHNGRDADEICPPPSKDLRRNDGWVKPELNERREIQI